MNTYTGRCTYIFNYTGIVCLKSKQAKHATLAK